LAVRKAGLVKFIYFLAVRKSGLVKIYIFFDRSESWTCKKLYFLAVRKAGLVKIPKNFKIFPKFFQNFKNGAGPKNSLVHPELWVCHF